MSQYAILLYAPAPADPEQAPPEEMTAQVRYAQQIQELGGIMSAAQALQPSTTATSIRGDLITDGPFTETKEVLAGFFVLEARDLDHALQIAKLCPTTQRGAVEIRPIFASAD